MEFFDLDDLFDDLSSDDRDLLFDDLRDFNNDFLGYYYLDLFNLLFDERALFQDIDFD